MWPTMAHLRGHLKSEVQYRYPQTRRSKEEMLYQGDTPLSDLEVVVVELRFVVGGADDAVVEVRQEGQVKGLNRRHGTAREHRNQEIRPWTRIIPSAFALAVNFTSRHAKRDAPRVEHSLLANTTASGSPYSREGNPWPPRRS